MSGSVLDTALLLAFVVGAVFVSSALTLSARKSEEVGVPSSVRAKALLTPPEQRFLDLLEVAMPEYRVFAQVSMGALLDPARGLSHRERLSVRGRFSQKIVDFVVVDRTACEVVALVELDDRTHSPVRDQKRDTMTSEAGYRTVRFHRDRWPTRADVRAAVLPQNDSIGDSYVAAV